MNDSTVCKIQSLNFAYNRHAILKNVSLDIKKGQCLVILGASGSGKSTLGKILAGHLMPLNKDAISWQIKTQNNPSHLEIKRQTQLVYQDPGSALTPFYTPFKTIAEVLNLHFPSSKSSIESQAITLLEQFGLTKDLYHRKIKFLSGGQKQRLNLARAFSIKPSVLILDEPLSSCDVFLQKEILDLLKKTIKESNLTCIIILHDLYQAAYIADTICLLNEGAIDSMGPTETFIKSPPTPYAKKFLESF